MSYFQISILIFAAIAIFIAIAMFAISRRDRIRKEYYDIKNNEVRLDKTREVLERQIAELYQQIYRDKGRFGEINDLQITGEMVNPRDLESGTFKAPKFFQRMGVEEIVQIEPKFVFVLTPFSSQEYKTFSTVQMICSSIGLNARRGDEKRIVGPILPHILEELAKSQIVICNLNSRNPNVLYELGIAHAIGKPIILIAEAQEELPLDVSHFSIIIYNDLAELRSSLTSAISRLALSGDLDHNSKAIREQEAVIQISDPEHLHYAITVLKQHENISRAFVLDHENIYVSGESPSRKFISDIGEILRDNGIQSGNARLIR